jgi:hypothetical protein
MRPGASCPGLRHWLGPLEQCGRGFAPSAGRASPSGSRSAMPSRRSRYCRQAVAAARLIAPHSTKGEPHRAVLSGTAELGRTRTAPGPGDAPRVILCGPSHGGDQHRQLGHRDDVVLDGTRQDGAQVVFRQPDRLGRILGTGERVLTQRTHRRAPVGARLAPETARPESPRSPFAFGHRLGRRPPHVFPCDPGPVLVLDTDLRGDLQPPDAECALRPEPAAGARSAPSADDAAAPRASSPTELGGVRRAKVARTRLLCGCSAGSR